PARERRAAGSGAPKRQGADQDPQDLRARPRGDDPQAREREPSAATLLAVPALRRYGSGEIRRDDLLRDPPQGRTRRDVSRRIVPTGGQGKPSGGRISL